MAEILRKEEVLIEENHIGFDIKETEGDLAMAEGFKFKRHTGFLNHPHYVENKTEYHELYRMTRM
ncbi:MAG: hypothetical protein KGZ49_12540, partial [Syntrophaceae bacterium]|nr:hypothetical protein [Syntrophaceae bacterium]